MAKLQIDFSSPTVGGYEGFDSKDIHSALPDRYKESGKPLVIYLESEDDENIAEMNLSKGVLADERIAVGGKMFNMVKINGDQITKTHPFWKTLGGKSLPRFVVVENSGKKVGSIEGKTSPSSLFKLMKRAAIKTYKTPIDKFIKDYQRVLTDLDKLESNRSALEVKKNASTEKLTKAKERKLQIEAAKLEAAGLVLAEREEKLLEFRYKESKVAKG